MLGGMSEENTAEPTTRRVDPGLAQRVSMGMGTLTLAGAAFFGVAAQHDAAAADTMSASPSSVQADSSPVAGADDAES
jgi:hypothetical protein